MVRHLDRCRAICYPKYMTFDEIHPDIRTEIEEMYNEIKYVNPDAFFRVEFEDDAEMQSYLSQAIAYCAQRPEGAIRFDRSPFKFNSPVIDVRIADLDDEEWIFG